ncbi:putative Coiled-coil domain-containing protein 22 [Monocercomonoides exilis]|uniref:putative Coiled-coil domain-containing protein 22 n=1 Tax=Monocercomonoides exilis TaxID=2049356 RepID=UPI003559EB7F|nr:putative Coiled-coil domain-containing protein 22 [Monocercomonoides exilis]|eukprot:MONOS_2222.1-p1 / transcript=MONOS_2222.1 / gene=MONOS_2222 / organism=Monocercomonoides_exilis_PA203 / gene_product=Coiled-coil domain-containing protein 22 / transcript_product=Coiled-coil domain-containing protein 22 / location=Mono_scaffold00044:89848-91991(-) / protein_length=573 / sequence_SO=supercontig / SO=protein_coding / is_pseudo=false
MDDADAIMIMTLRQAGCNVDSDITSCAQFTPEVLMNCCAVILNMIDSDLEIPLTVPPDGVKRFKYCSSIAKAMKDSGYNGECTYDLFTYPNQTDTRKFISFLIEKLPRAEQKESETIVQEQTLLGQMREAVRQSFFDPWYIPLLQKPPLFCHFKRHFSHPYEGIDKDKENEIYQKGEEKAEKERKEKIQTAVSVVARAVSKAMFDQLDTMERSTLLSLSDALKKQRNSKQGGRIDHMTRFAQEEQPTGEVSIDKNDVKDKEQLEEKVEESEERLKKFQAATTEAQRQVEAEMARARELVERLQSATNEVAVLKDEIKKKQLIVAMLKDPDNAMSELTRLNEKTMSKIKQLGSDWEEVRGPLVEKYHKCVEKNRGDQSLSHKLTEELKEVRTEMAQLIEEAKKKQARLQQLKQEYEGMDKTAERQKYVGKITEMHANLTAQKNDINKIINDMKSLMSDSNTAEERLDRVFHDADEMIFLAAKVPDPKIDRDEAAKNIYRGLVLIHENYGKLSATYNEIGKYTNRLLDTKERIDDQLRYGAAEKIEKLNKDLNALSKENDSLREKLKDDDDDDDE